ncbi:MAG: GNAT family N-acetyltransferase [Candidatus Ozemobacteraceae bacterium]
MRESWKELLFRLGDGFNEELSRLLSGDGRVTCLPEDGPAQKAGWFLTRADVEAGEWNLAHPFGRPELYGPLLETFPSAEPLHLLIPREDYADFRVFYPREPAETLIWHRDARDEQSGVIRHQDAPEEKSGLIWHRDGRDEQSGVETTGSFSPEERCPKSRTENSSSMRESVVSGDWWGFEGRVSTSDRGQRCPISDVVALPGFTWRFIEENPGHLLGLRGYVLQESSIAALVRVIHETPETIEIYVETLPQLRGQGLATALVTELRQRARAAGRRLIYVVSDENPPSLRVAEKIGLKPFAWLFRIPYEHF